MRTNLLISLLLAFVLYSCNSNPKYKNKATKVKLNDSSSNTVENIDTPLNQSTKNSSSLFLRENIPNQIFKIKGTTKSVLSSKGGVKITIPKDAFINSSGNLVKGNIKIVFKEVLTVTDMVLGNLTTTTNGKFLESGGMIYIDASANGKPLKLAKNKAVEFNVPTKNRKEGMMIFEGEEIGKSINWVRPKPIDKKMDTLPKYSSKDTFWRSSKLISGLKKDNFVMAYKVLNKQKIASNKYFKTIEKLYLESIKKIGKTNNSIYDTVVHIGLAKIQLKTFSSYINLLTTKKEELDKADRIKGSNSHIYDDKINYIFQAKKIGWTNIDRLLTDKRTERVDFITKINSTTLEPDEIYISIAFPNLNMYIPGYQKMDGTFSFTHGDYENPKFPIGETAIILATGYRRNVAYYALKKVVIAKEQTVSLQLQETTKDQLKQTLKDKI